MAGSVADLVRSRAPRSEALHCEEVDVLSPTMSRGHTVPILAMVVVMVAGIMSAASAAADNTVTQQVTSSGTRSASIADATMAAAAYSNTQSEQTTGSMTLTATDASGSNLGWNVTVQAGSFVQVADPSQVIPANNFSLTSAANPNRVSGQNVNNQGGPKVPATSPLGALDVQRKVIQADAGFGKGTYSQLLGVSLLVPAGTPLGTYQSTLTVTVAVGP